MLGWGAGGCSAQIISDNCWSVHGFYLSVLSRGTIWPVSYLKQQMQGGRQQQSFSLESTPVFKQRGGNDFSVKRTFVFR